MFEKKKLILVNIESDAFKRSQNTAFDLYTKYQTIVHHEPPTDLNEFIDFLCNSPIQVSYRMYNAFFIFFFFFFDNS